MSDYTHAEITEILAYFNSRYAAHLVHLGQRRTVTASQAERAAAILAGNDVERKYDVTIGDVVTIQTISA